MDEQPDGPQYLTWLQSLQIGDKVAIEGKYGQEVGTVASVRPDDDCFHVTSRTMGSCRYTFSTSNRIEAFPAGRECFPTEPNNPRRALPLTPQREAQATDRQAHHKKAAVLSTTDWGRQTAEVVDAVLAAFNEAKEWVMEAGDTAPQITYDQRDGDYYRMDCPTCFTQVTRQIPRSYDYDR